MTTAFQIELNGKLLCLAGVNDKGVLTAIATHNAGNQTLSIDVGGLLTQSNTHATWAKQDLTVGDQITIKIVDAAPNDISQPIEERTELVELVEQEERKHFEKLKEKYENAA